MANPGLLAAKGQPGSSFPSPSQSPDLFPFGGLAQRLLPMERIRELYRRAQQPINRSLMENVLAEMQISYHAAQTDLERIPRSGPVLVVANHPFGIADGAVLGALLSRVRPDVKILTNYLLASVPELHECCFFVDPFGTPRSAALNLQALKRATAWLRGGGVLAMFPAGEVSHLRLRGIQVSDPEWLPAAARLVRITGAAALPVYFPGRNSLPFQAMGLVHPRLRTFWLLNEFLAQEGKNVEVRVGNVISAAALRSVGGEKDAVRYLRWRTYLLGHRARARRATAAWPNFLPRKKPEPVVEAVANETLQRDVEALPAECRLVTHGEYSAYLAQAEEIPNAMRELGRLREVTFRAAGEGTGKRSDLDRFDRHYRHLLLWNHAKHELVGAYRLGATTEILPRLGPAGLYTSTLFRYDPRIFERIGPALELGRSFVRPEYQRQYAPLLMLWRGVGRYLASHPEFAVLFGAVSVSGRYNRLSRELIVRFFEARERRHELSDWITPRRPFRPGWALRNDYAGCQDLKDVQDLGDPISDVESDGKELPILLKQYARLGGRIVGFNVDKNFSGVLDGLVLVDLRQTDPAVLERYMSKQGIQAFQRYHGIVPAAEEA